MRTFFDVNHRARQWTWEEAAPVLRSALGDVDILLAGGHDLAQLLDMPGEPVALARAAIAHYGHEVVVLRENEHVGEQRDVTVTAVTADEVHPRRAVLRAGRRRLRRRRRRAGRADRPPAGGRYAGRRGGHAARACAVQHTIVGDAWVGRPEDLALGAERRIVR